MDDDNKLTFGTTDEGFKLLEKNPEMFDPMDLPPGFSFEYLPQFSVNITLEREGKEPMISKVSFHTQQEMDDFIKGLQEDSDLKINLIPLQDDKD